MGDHIDERVHYDPDQRQSGCSGFPAAAQSSRNKVYPLGGEIMFAAWIQKGLEIATVCFFSALIFLAYCAVVIAVFGLGLKLLGVSDSEGQESGKKHRPY